MPLLNFQNETIIGWPSEEWLINIMAVVPERSDTSMFGTQLSDFSLPAAHRHGQVELYNCTITNGTDFVHVYTLKYSKP